MKQKAPFSRGSIKRQIDYDSHLAHDLHSMDFLQILKERHSSNVTLSFDVDNEYISSAPETDSDVSVAQISLNMRVPFQQRFRVKLPLLESIKQVWIQYISFFLVFFYIIYVVVLGYAFQNNIIQSTVSSEIMKVNRNYHTISAVKKNN